MDTKGIIEIIGIVIGIIGIAIPFIDRFQNRRISWGQVKGYVSDLFEAINKDNWKPEVLLSFPKGGLIVADLLGHQFGNNLDIVSIFTKRTLSEQKEIIYQIRCPYLKLEMLRQKKVLIVDDVLENGLTIKNVIEMLVDQGVSRKNIRCAVLGRSNGVDPAIQPNYFAFDYNKSRNLHLPWGKVTL